MAKYCEVTDVSNELNGLTIDGTSTPSSATVDSWIEEESEFLIKETGRLWGSETFTNEYHDYDGSGFMKTDYAPIISVTKLETERNGIDATSESWLELSEGRTSTKNFFIYKDEGEIQFHGTTKPYAGYQNLRITYVAGYASVNVTVKAIVAKKVALRTIGAQVNSQASEEGGNVTVGAISISDPSNVSLESISTLQNDIKDLQKSIGTFRTFRANRRYN